VTPERLRIVFLADAVFSALVSLLLLAGTWDGLYDALDLPQAQPALLAQVGGAVLWGMAYLLWLAARTPALMVPVARASALMSVVAAAVIVAWLINGELGIDALGTTLLIVAAVVLAAFAAAYLQAGLRSGGYGPEPPPPAPPT
jgi:hypothetical protein